MLPTGVFSGVTFNFVCFVSSCDLLCNRGLLYHSLSWKTKKETPINRALYKFKLLL